MADPFPHFRSALEVLRGLLRAAIADRINARREGDIWGRVEAAAEDALSWADIIAAAALRIRGLRQESRFPDSTWQSAVNANPWAQAHVVQSGPVIDAEAERFVKATQAAIEKRISQREDVPKSALRRYHEEQIRRMAEEAMARRSLNRTARFVPQRLGVIAPEQALMEAAMLPKAEGELIHLSAIPEYAIRRFERDSVGTIANDSEQLTLNDPEVGAAFPFTKYLTRDDSRVRPTHRAMQGFVAQRGDPIWKSIRPLCGWNCRCYARQLTIFEARDLGYLTGSGYAKFLRRWPNMASERNFDSGAFPDAGWKGAKFVAGAPLIPVELVA